MKALLLLAAISVAGCPHPPNPQPAPPPDARMDAAPAPSGPPACPATTTETADNVCDALFTKAKWCAGGTACACVVCQGGSGCIDQATQIYCISGGGCVLDPACERIPDAGSVDGGASGAAKKRLKAPPKKSEGPSPVLPKADLTPGTVDPHVTQANIQSTICVHGYTVKVRPPARLTNKIKATSFAAYGIKTSFPNDYELDHLISLELGGAPEDPKNLWPEPWESHGHKIATKGTGAETKDQVEDWLHRQVCTGKMQLVDAQKKIATNWAAVLEEMKK